jgi:hypothetical protein
VPYTNTAALGRADLDGFLLADIGTEANGMTLSVLSALARGGIDPWEEAERLAAMPSETAVSGLAGIIAAMPAGLWSLPDARPVAVRLVALLPSRAARPVGQAAPSAPLRTGLSWPVVALLGLLALSVTATIWSCTDRPGTSIRGASSSAASGGPTNLP